MRHLNGEAWNTRLTQTRRYRLGSLVAGLKLNHKVHMLMYEDPRIANGGLGAVSVVEGEQLNAGREGAAADTLGDQS
jgi:hypothetical protein